MKNSYLYIILIFWCGLLSANPTNSSYACIERSRSEGVTYKAGDVTHLYGSKDSVTTKKSDSLKTAPLGHTKMSPIMERWQKEKATPVQLTSEVENRKFKSFPELDNYTSNVKDGIIKILSEFTTEYVDQLKANARAKLDNNSKEVLEAGENVFKILKENQNFINIIGGNEVTQLPVGINKSITASSDITLGIVRMEYYPTYTVVDMFAKLNLGELGVENLLFVANDVKISKDGGIYGEARLTLLEDAYVGQNGGQWLFIFKGGKDAKTGKGTGSTYIDIDCEGKVKKIGLNLDVRIAKSVAIPINEDGTHKFPNSIEPGTGESPKDNDTYLGTSFSLETDELGGLLIELNLPMFELKALPNWGFKMENTILDLSDTQNVAGIDFPDIYKNQGLLQGNDNLWRGFHSQEVRVTLPPEFKKKGSEQRISIGARNLFIDNYGVSGDFFATNVLDINEGDASKWQISVDSIGVDLKVNRFIKAGFNGEIVLPISDQNSSGGTLAYKGLITADQFYSVNVEAVEDVSFDIFKAKAKIFEGSYITLEVENNRFYPEANLTGLMSVRPSQDDQFNSLSSESLNDSTSVVDLEFEGLSFQDLKIQSRQRPYLTVKYAGFKDDITLPKIAGFELGFYDINLTTDTEDNAILGFNCFMNLDSEGIHGDVGLQILGKLDEGDLLKWKYNGIKVTDVEVDVKRKSFEFYGSLSFFEDNPVYGKGFAGDLQLYAEDLGIEVGARGLFGATDGYRYWFVDGHGRPTKDNNKNFTIFDIGGGVYHHMRKAGMNEETTSLSGINYQPDINTSLGFKALGAFEVKNGASFTALAGIEISFNSQSAGGGVSRVGFYGAAMLIQGKSEGGNPQTPFGTVDEMQQTVASKENSLSNFHELSIDKEGLKYFADNVFPELLTGEELFAAQVAIDLDFRNRAYWGLLDVYLNAGTIRGEGEKNLLGRLEYYNAPEDWYIYVGTPTHRFGLADIPIGPFKAGVNLYFMTGTILPDPAAPPQNVINLLHLSGDELLFGRNFDQELARGTGYAFGAKFELGMGFDWNIIYADVTVGAGFDLMMRDFGDAHCKGKEGPLGMDGWYATGQMYAYLQGEIGAQIKLFGIRKKVPILSAGIAVLAQAQLPNPWFIKGYAGVDIKVLGVVKIHSRLKVIIGEECEIIGKTGMPDIVMISDITPRDGLTDVDVFDAIQVAFNAPVDSEIPFEDNEGRKTYRIGLKEISVKTEGAELQGSFEYNNEKDILIYNTDEILPPEQEITVLVRVSFDEKISGNWVAVTSEGIPVIEEKVVTFTTGDAPRKIPYKNIEFMYPIVDQQYMLPKESNVGFVQLDKGQQYLFGNGFSDELYFIDESGNKTKASFSYNASEKRLNFSIPNLNNETNYTYALVTLNPGDIEEDQVLSTVEFTKISEDLEISNNTLTGSVSNGAFISRLNFSFKTSKHNTFKQKMRSINTNYTITDLDEYPGTTESIAYVGKITLHAKDYEPFGINDISGTVYTANKPLINYNALMTDKYYTDDIYPLLYQEYPLDRDISVNRNPDILGVPPTRSLSVIETYRTFATNQPNHPMLKTLFPFRWRLPITYYMDYIHLQYTISNRYKPGVDDNKREKYKYLMFTGFPFARKDTYKVEFSYILPNNSTGNSETIDYEKAF
ncbi:hypothetical protein R3X28_03430 [Maribacter sp. TH_r10]|uniref:hypothetical protein n=1 Tax=Maribacter sp. TH_r10 TaxID=3082086 RepID=UPI0029544EFB|nr:hypothetical protein [Maribacter sp. TH_r10]MDV7137909.1 hypothetical protein [Maribacter sp. TH_r10]